MNWRLAALGLAVTLAGCSYLDLGPEPSNSIGPRPAGPESLTDPGLSAVTPTATGATVALPGSGAIPGTMPSATQPTTTEPASGPAATNPALTPGLGAGVGGLAPSSGHVTIPAQLTVQEAILVGLQNNVGLRVQKYNVPISRAQVESQRAAFDPALSGSIQGGRSATPTGGGNNPPARYTDQIDATLGIQEFLPTGTTISGEYTTSNSFYSDHTSSSRTQLSVTQALLRGAGLDVNLASLRSAEISTKISQYELRAFAEQLVDNIEETYWDLAYAERQVLIVQNALDFAKQQLQQTMTNIQVGKIAQSEEAAAQAQVALEEEGLINAKSTLETTRLQFLRLISPAGEPFWDRTFTVETQPFIPTGAMDPVEKHVDVAMRLRPDLNEAKLEVQRGDLTVVQTKNGLLPQLDFFVTLGKTGYANSFGQTIPALNGDEYDVLAGVRGSYDLGNRAAHASYQQSLLSRDQLIDTLNNLRQTVQIDVRTQYIEVERTRQQIDATRATRIAQEEALRVESAKLQSGRSTSLLVAQAQNNLLSAQLSEVQAVTQHLKALTALYRLEGSLLIRRGLEAPGAAPVQGPGWLH
ncbi:MAG TPA: TolC family protein [Phycisphaerae bacterium]|nr:TolC family protein [Phycisphaerae bacterium]